MSVCYNHVALIGRLTKDSELKETSHQTRASFVLAVDRPYKKEDGTSETDFINVVLWGKRAEILSSYLLKGRLVLVEGRIQIRQYEQGDVRKSVAEIVAENFQFLDYKGNKKESVETEKEFVL